jgi:DNA-binding FadR family transcriptional regulator
VLASEVARPHAADEVFDRLAYAILAKELVAGEPLPPERVLAQQFGVSRVIVRQAVHRLADFGLVRVKQGGATLVLDPRASSDLRTLELRFRLGPRTARERRMLMERQLLAGHAILVLAERRAGDGERRALARLREDYLAGAKTDADYMRFEEGFWRTLSAGTKNPFYEFDVNWWYRLLGEEPRAHNPAFGPTAPQGQFLAELVRRLVACEKVAAFYLAAMMPLIDHVRSSS